MHLHFDVQEDKNMAVTLISILLIPHSPTDEI